SWPRDWSSDVCSSDLYERFGQRWQPKNMFQPLVNDIRIYMSLKGSAGGGRGGGAAGAGGEGGPGAAAPGSGGVGGLSADITWDRSEERRVGEEGGVRG